MNYVYDIPHLSSVAEQQRDAYRDASPFPHVVLDDFLHGDAATLLAQAFPPPQADFPWERFAHVGLEHKLACSREDLLSQPLRSAIHDFNAGPFIGFLEKLTGISGLVGDPGLHGGGIHVSRTGDHLGIHADFNFHTGLQLHRRLNLIIYLTPNWQTDWGGEIELWDTQAKACIRRVSPIFNRAVIFNTRSDTFHGHPQPLLTPAGVVRQSIALYYYSATRPADELRPPHNTLYKDLM